VRSGYWTANFGQSLRGRQPNSPGNGSLSCRALGESFGRLFQRLRSFEQRSPVVGQPVAALVAAKECQGECSFQPLDLARHCGEASPKICCRTAQRSRARNG
jgi:hypothetical protein